MQAVKYIMVRTPSKRYKGSSSQNCPPPSTNDVTITSSMVDVQKISLVDERILDFLHLVNVQGMLQEGKESGEVASILFADFSTRLNIETVLDNEVPAWNKFSRKLSKKMALLASRYVADNGWYISLCYTDHFGIVSGHAIEMGFKVMHTILILIPNGYVRKTLELERVETLLLGLFYRKGQRPIYDQCKGETVDSHSFDAKSGILVEREDADYISQHALRGAAKRSLDFFRYGGLGFVCKEMCGHCLCVDKDPEVFERHLACYKSHSANAISASISSNEEDTNWDQYEPGSQCP